MATYAPAVYTSVVDQVNYAFSFETIEQADVYVKVGENLTTNFTITNYTTSGGGTVVLTTAPEVGTEVTVFRDTDITSMNATFMSGSAIRAQDLNGDFTQLRNSIQETESNIDSIIENPYELPVASDVTLGGIKVGQNLSIDSDGVLSSADTSGVPEAPNDGKQYGRQSESWTEITATSGVSKIIAGTNVTISPTSGEGEVTINSTATGGTGGATYKGTIDMTLAAPAAENGDFYVNTATSGTVNASWTGLGGTPLSGGERVIYNGGTNQWDMLPAEQDLWQRAGSPAYLIPADGVSEVRLEGSQPTYTFVDTDNNDTRVSSLVYDAVGDRTEWSFAYRTDLPGLDANPGSVQIRPAGGVRLSEGGGGGFVGLSSRSIDWTNPTGDTVYTAQNYSLPTFTVDTMGNAYIRKELVVGQDGGSSDDIAGTVNIKGTLTAIHYDIDSLPELPS